MFTSDGFSVLSSLFGWIWTVANFRIPGLAITLWQAFAALFMLKFVFKIAMSFANTHIGGVSYRGSSYHGTDDKYKNWNVNDTDWDSDW